MTHTTIRGIAAAGAVLFAMGCGGAGMTSYTPVNEHTKFSADTLYLAARDGLEDLGYQVKGADSQTHTVDTREKEVAVSSIPRLSYRYSFHVETTGGVLAITAACTENSAASEGTFKDCGDDRPERVVREQDAIKKRVLELAPATKDKNPDWGAFGEHPAGDDKDTGDAKSDDKDKEEAPKGKPDKAASKKSEEPAKEGASGSDAAKKK